MTIPDYPTAQWRLLYSEPMDGALNMAIDEAILLGVAAGSSPPTLRFFGWTPPCLSLGYAQPLTDADSDRLRARGWGLVRRPTGGKAILHTDELTYSVILPQTDARVAGGIIESYRRLSDGLVRGLISLGLMARNDKKYSGGETSELTDAKENPVCFEVPSNYEITVIGKKLIGSAQARRQGVVLQHGTLPLTGDLTRICEALTFADEAARKAAKQRVRARAITLEEALGRTVSWQAAANAMKHGFREALRLEFQTAGLAMEEWRRAERLRDTKYGVVQPDSVPIADSQPPAN